MNSMLRMETLLRLMIMLLVINGFVPKWQIISFIFILGFTGLSQSGILILINCATLGQTRKIIF